jgi:Integrase zinc binding domain
MACGTNWILISLYIPDVSELRLEVISEFHDPPYHGHFGITKTLKAITSKFFWPKMDLDIKATTKQERNLDSRSG